MQIFRFMAHCLDLTNIVRFLYQIVLPSETTVMIGNFIFIFGLVFQFIFNFLFNPVLYRYGVSRDVIVAEMTNDFKTFPMFIFMMTIFVLVHCFHLQKRTV